MQEEKTKIINNMNSKMWSGISSLENLLNQSKEYDIEMCKFNVDIEKNY